jgi:hypothetical protein
LTPLGLREACQWFKFEFVQAQDSNLKARGSVTKKRTRGSINSSREGGAQATGTGHGQVCIGTGTTQGEVAAVPREGDDLHLSVIS